MAAWLASPLLGRGDSKVARGVRARLGAGLRLTEWARIHRDVRRPLLWIHAPSVGEGLQAKAVIEALRERRPEVQVVFTYFSPSAELLAARMPADVSSAVPWETTGEVGRAMTAVRPDLLAFTKTEVWPVLASGASAAGAATALVAATLPAKSSRRRWPARSVLGPALACLDVVAAIAEDDAERFIGLGARPSAVSVTGDPGIDSAARRAAAADPAAPHLRPFAVPRRPTLVAGSTWPSDEAVLIPALAAARSRHPELRAVIAPHEPSEAAVRSLEGSLGRSGLRTARLSRVESAGVVGDADAVVVDRVGVLADLYTIGDVAWVGGGFHAAGLHSVLEPAAAGLPVLFGPRHGGSHAAGELIALAAARAVRDAGGATSALAEWLSDVAARASAGVAGRRYIAAHLGAAGRTADLLSRLLRR